MERAHILGLYFLTRGCTKYGATNGIYLQTSKKGCICDTNANTPTTRKNCLCYILPENEIAQGPVTKGRLFQDREAVQATSLDIPSSFISVESF